MRDSRERQKMIARNEKKTPRIITSPNAMLNKYEMYGEDGSKALGCVVPEVCVEGLRICIMADKPEHLGSLAGVTMKFRNWLNAKTNGGRIIH